MTLRPRGSVSVPGAGLTVQGSVGYPACLSWPEGLTSFGPRTYRECPGPFGDPFRGHYQVAAGEILPEEWMTKADLVEQVAEAIGPGITKKDCALVVDGFLSAVKRALAEGENIEIRGFGTFKVRKRKARMARNPRTGEPVEVPSRFVPVFKPSKHLRNKVAKGGPPAGD